MKGRKSWKGIRVKPLFFKDTSNYFSLLNLRSLIERFDIKIEYFAYAPMHMLFLGVTKHLLAHVERLFGIRILLFEYLVESYLNISSLAEISLLIGVQLLILQMVTF